MLIRDEKEKIRLERGLLKRKCPNCGIIFYSDNKNRRFCSNSCRVLFCKNRKDENGELFNYDDDDENYDSEISNINDMSNNELISQIQKNADLNLQLKMSEKDYEILKKDFDNLKAENERLKGKVNDLIAQADKNDEELEEINDLKQEIEELQTEGQDLLEKINVLEMENDDLTKKSEQLEKENKKLNLYVLAIEHQRVGRPLTFDSVQKIYDVKLNEPDRFILGRFELVRSAGQHNYEIKAS